MPNVLDVAKVLVEYSVVQSTQNHGLFHYRRVNSHQLLLASQPGLAFA